MKFELTVIKNNKKDQISHSVSTYEDGDFRSYNFTGSLSSLDEFYTADGVDLSNELVSADVPSTVIVNNESMGEAILERVEAIFIERALNNDGNPAIKLVGECESIKVPGNIILSKVSRLVVDAEVELKQRSTDVLANLRKGRTTPGSQMANAVRNSNSVVSKAGNFVKKYF